MTDHHKTRGYEGFETFTSALKMGVKMHVTLIKVLVVLHLLTFIALVALTNTVERRTALKWALAKGLEQSAFREKAIIVDLPDGKTARISAVSLVKAPWAVKTAGREFRKLGWLLALSCLIYLTYPLLLRVFGGISKSQSSKRHVRGARIITHGELEREFRRRNEKTDLPLGSIKMPVTLENRHTLVIGKPGSGKTQCIRPIIKRWYQRGQKGIIYDNKGEYFSEFFDPDTDLLFNPLDERSLGWNLFNELNSYPDVDAVAASLIPPPIAATDPFWNDAARGVFSGILHHLYQQNKRNNSELWKLLTAEAQDMAKKLKNTKGGEAGYRYITQNAKNSRQAESVLAVTMQYTKCFEYMAGNEGTFKITDWLHKGRGMIYITNYEDIEETLKPILSLFVDLVGRKILSMPDDINRRILFGLDEFGSLQRLSTIVNLLTRGRSKGVCVFLGIQDDGQTEKIYTPHIRKSIDNACGNRITFALSGETAERESRFNIGESENIDTQRSQSMGPHDMRDGINIGEYKKREALMLPSEIANLPDLHALVRLRNYDYVLSKWNWEPARQIHEPFVLRRDLSMENIISNNNDVIPPAGSTEEKRPELDIEPVS